MSYFRRGFVQQTTLMSAFLALCTLSYSGAQIDATKVAETAKPALVMIKGVTESGDVRSGSGFIVDPSGTIVTSLHVIQELKTAAVRLANGDVYDRFTVRAFDSRRDLAVIQIAGFDLPVVDLGNSSTVKPGDSVILLGNPFGLEGSVSAGIVSGIRDLAGMQVIQTDAAANPGNSGGPMMNSTGEVVGVLSFKIGNSENLNFVIPINYARGLIDLPGSYTLSEVREELEGSTDVFEEEEGRSQFPTQWKSLSSGTLKILRIEGEYLYYETIMPDDMQEHYQLAAGELKKDGDGYTGVYRTRFNCSWYSHWVAETRWNNCAFEFPIGITLLSPTRTEGWGMWPPDGAKFNCSKCKYSKKPTKQLFTWIPAEQ